MRSRNGRSKGKRPAVSEPDQKVPQEQSSSAAKRQRSSVDTQNAAKPAGVSVEDLNAKLPGAASDIGLGLFNIPPEVLELVLGHLDARTLAVLSSCSKSFRERDRGTKAHPRLADKAAMDQLNKRCGPQHAARWRTYTWLQRLQLEETRTLFDRERCEKQGFTFVLDSLQNVSAIKLEGIGPKLLVSDLSTHDAPLLRWRMELRGNNAVEFGVIPVSMQDQPKALHKCYPGTDGDRPSGFCSAITVGSLLSVKLPLMKGSIIEILARRDRLEFIVNNPADGLEMTWQNSVTVPKPYKGPLEFRFEQDLPPEHAVKLAVTCWARAAFDVLHTQPIGNVATHDVPVSQPPPPVDVIELADGV